MFNTMFSNKLITNFENDTLTTAVAIKTIPSAEVILLAQAAGYDTVFIDLEHSTLSISDAAALCTAAILADITPFVRVPSQCGSGFVQRVLDGGAMGIVYPHINTAGEARNAVAMTKFPPQGNRSLTAALPHFQYRRVAATDVIGQVNAVGSTVFVMIETAEALGNAQEIAAVEGVDVLLLGANDLSLSMGILGGWDHPDFGKTLELVAEACLRTKKVFGISGIYARPDIVKHAVEVLKARYVLGHSDMGLMAVAMKKNAEMLRGLK